MPLRTTDCRHLFGEEHAREIFASCASLRRTAEGDGHGSSVPAVLWTGRTQVVHHRLHFASAIRQTAEADSALRMHDTRTSRASGVVAGVRGWACRHGIHRRLLEASVEYSRR